MIRIQSIDLTRMNVTMNRYVTELGMKAADVSRNQAGLFLKDVVLYSAPSNLARAQRRAEKFSKNVFNQVRPAGVSFSARKRGQGSMRWLTAGNGQNGSFLLGVEQENFQPSITLEQAKALYSEKTNPPGKKFGQAYERVGKRGKFHVMKLNRVVIGRGTFRAFLKSLRDSFGKLKAAWAVGWDELQVKGRIPAWVRKHIEPARASGRGQIIPKLQGARPSVTIICRSGGCASPESLRMIRSALKRRTEAMKKDLLLYAKGIKKVAGFKNS